ncbi:MAG TPA: PASTA domain-containing protein, partial [Candidatus Hydrogenedentes bacterium]|nr:PASTA domain-containing protein [Candidatus Hydrogenedentota bacterium]
MKKIRKAIISAGLLVVLVVIAGCPEPRTTVIVPNVVGMTQSAAQNAITGAQLTVGTVTEQYSEAVVLGQVISQNPEAGIEVFIGTSINLVISLGPISGEGEGEGEGEPGLEDIEVLYPGLGTQASPYLVSTAAHLRYMSSHREHWDKVFQLQNDIDMSDSIAWNPVGTVIFNSEKQRLDYPFTGTFDGHGYAI